MTDSRVFDRLVRFDERSRAYGVVPRLRQQDPTKARSYTYTVNGPALDQGREGRCVEYAICHNLLTRPVPTDRALIDQILAVMGIYHPAQHRDPWDGCHKASSCEVPHPSQYEGTSVISGVQVAVALGVYSEYLWCFGLNDLILGVGHKGPAVLGLNWYTGMSQADDKGWIHVAGEQVGGHAISCVGVNVRERFFKLINSWGPSWGKRGYCKISFDNMERLLSEKGEAVIPIRNRSFNGTLQTVPLAA